MLLRCLPVSNRRVRSLRIFHPLGGWRLQLRCLGQLYLSGHDAAVISPCEGKQHQIAA